MKVAGSILAFEATNYVLYTYFIGNYNQEGGALPPSVTKLCIKYLCGNYN